MRIIGGKLKSIRLQAPKNLPVRPTTDISKESLFNILFNRFNFDEISALDLFAGTGNISFELASRGCPAVTSVDKFPGCVEYIKRTAAQHQLTAIKTYKADVFKYLDLENVQYDLIFADPPYDMPNPERIAEKVFERNLLKTDGLLVIEHASQVNLENQPNFSWARKYGQSTFSFFEVTEPIKE
ncbi:16S rRNA (guanine(966)-N(2))-methyltransferase RsmD [Solitalea longa]|uniref:16S rRNA (Guanine(966)-N(2))-methyltransferase RsmD n=1 Tax=Solitalea longa TaxID=2079460 RepID=A0A2S5A6R8_9SPHI|nr:RsmD family RNA methyltransferase [Solitalea longa]POY37803.1 16S rRNA (guanine(966)-N(2))-methyltransferase RsmD [Solitalea longa]